ncbi:MAG: hypothetical protein ACOYO9_08825 [Candidatus Nanopelagicales bacterium]
MTDPTYAAMDRRLPVMLDPKGTLAGVVAHELKDAIQPGTGESFLVRIVTDITARKVSSQIARNRQIDEALLVQLAGNGGAGAAAATRVLLRRLA